ncbi:MAG: gamma-glutamyltransferase family protein [Bacillota bacterium]
MPKPRSNFASLRSSAPTLQPLIMGRHGMVASGQFSATMAGLHILKAGGNAVDAGVAAGIAINVMLFDRTSFAGVAPIILYHAMTNSVVTLDGLGVWPRLASMEYFHKNHGGKMPKGIMRTVTPGAPDAWLMALAQYGTMRLAEVLEPAWEMAAKGAPVSAGVALGLANLEKNLDVIDPEAQRVFFPDGRAPRAGDILVQEDLGRLFKALMDEEAKAKKEGLGRREAIMRARDLFYKGWIARAISEFYESKGGWLRYSDLACHRVEISAPLHTKYRGYDVYACGPWCQGPLLIEFLNILENFNLDKMEHNSAQYIHLLVEAMDLAFSDRENFYADPRMIDVPLVGLTSKEYGKIRASLVNMERATGHMPLPGNPWEFEQGARARRVEPVDISGYIDADAGIQRDTSYVAVGDEHGNLFSATPSDPVFDTAVIPGLGIACSGRGSQSRLQPGHPSALAPGKRPRLTPNPALAMLDGRPFMAFGCPGADVQTQGMLQFFLNLVDFSMNVQEAIEATRVCSYNFPGSFAPWTYHPGRVDVEARIDPSVVGALKAMGHDVRTLGLWSAAASSVHAVLMNPSSGVLLGGADPRREGSAAGW